MVFSERVWKGGRSALRLVHMLAVTLWHGMVLLARRDLRGSAEQMRFFAILVHDDMLAAVVWLQKRWPGDGPGLRPDRILVVKLDRIGDMVNTIPVIDALARRFPAAAIDVVAHPVPLSFFDGDPRIRERIPYRSALYHGVPFLPPSWNEWKTVAGLARRRYPLVVYLRGSAPFLLLGARSRFAATKYLMNEHVVERYLKAIRPFVREARLRPATLHLSADAKRAATALLGSGTDVLRIAVHATAAVALKEWPLDRYVALADELRRRYRAEIHFLASPDERDRLEAALAGSTSKHAVHTSLSLGKVAALIAACDLFVGNDSGLSHVAAAVHTPMVLVWGPANIHEARPLADPARCAIEYRAVPCRARCQEIRCVNDDTPMQCLRDVLLQDVLASAGRMLETVSEQSWRRVAPV